ncbi:hypothetical protein J7M22_05990 [Candidatus Poribacteria bacterium]|nr:hypothetical protein [Candidatus Poribacteria bacterium]
MCLTISVLSFILLLPLPTAFGHSRWYPHLHAKDVEKMLRRGEEMKGYILLMTLAFVALLSGMAVFVLKRGQEEAMRRKIEEHERLSDLVMRAARAASPHLARGDLARAIEEAIAEYSGSTGRKVERAYSATLRIGNDRISIRPIEIGGAHKLELKAMSDEAQVTCLIGENGSIEIEKLRRD